MLSVILRLFNISSWRQNARQHLMLLNCFTTPHAVNLFNGSSHNQIAQYYLILSYCLTEFHVIKHINVISCHRTTKRHLYKDLYFSVERLFCQAWRNVVDQTQPKFLWLLYHCDLQVYLGWRCTLCRWHGIGEHDLLNTV